MQEFFLAQRDRLHALHVQPLHADQTPQGAPKGHISLCVFPESPCQRPRLSVCGRNESSPEEGSLIKNPFEDKRGDARRARGSRPAAAVRCLISPVTSIPCQLCLTCSEGLPSQHHAVHDKGKFATGNWTFYGHRGSGWNRDLSHKCSISVKEPPHSSTPLIDTITTTVIATHFYHF